MLLSFVFYVYFLSLLPALLLFLLSHTVNLIYFSMISCFFAMQSPYWFPFNFGTQRPSRAKVFLPIIKPQSHHQTYPILNPSRPIHGQFCFQSRPLFTKLWVLFFNDISHICKSYLVTAQSDAAILVAYNSYCNLSVISHVCETGSIVFGVIDVTGARVSIQWLDALLADQVHAYNDDYFWCCVVSFRVELRSSVCQVVDDEKTEGEFWLVTILHLGEIKNLLFTHYNHFTWMRL